MRRYSSRGSLLVMALLVFSLLLALGLGLMTSQVSNRKAALSQLDMVRAKSLALAAWEDVRTKLAKDIFFPPLTSGQGFFSYSEDVYDSTDKDNPSYYGSYSVVIDTRYVAKSGHDDDITKDFVFSEYAGYYLITCVGKVGGRGEEPKAERTMYFEVSAAGLEVIRVHDRESL